jgi:acetoacetyl-CoA synthetase
VLFDANPAFPTLDRLWSLVAETRTTFAGFAAPYLMACRGADLHPGREHDFSQLRGLGSTGAPLPASGFRWAFDEVAQVPLSSISGGTDVCSAFVGGAPVLPVVAGRIPCRQLGWSVEALGSDGTAVIDEVGELVVTMPAPSMPVGFWGDNDRTRYAATYFPENTATWFHGDWITIGSDGSCVISGRSDATLNRGGVRLGTADFYSVVESDRSIEDSLVVHLDDDEGGLGELILFVVMKGGERFDGAVENRLTTALRNELSPRHVPDQVVEVPAVPRTISGKKLEVPVKRILQGVAPDRAASLGSLSDPQSLDAFVSFGARREG